MEISFLRLFAICGIVEKEVEKMWLDTFNEMRKKSGMSLEEISVQSGIPKGTLAKITSGITKAPPLETMRKLVYSMGYTLDDLDRGLERSEHFSKEEKTHIQKYRLLDPYGKEAVDGVLDVESRRCEAIRAAALHKERKEMEISQELQDNVIYLRFSVPGYSMPMSAGTGQEAGQEYPENYQLVREPPRGTSYIATVSGNSMEPTYHDGDLLFIHACEEIAVGQVGVFYMDGKQWVKELGAEVLLSHYPDYPPRTITEDIRCQGLVLGVCDKSYFE